jgi:hypothetical protein
MDRIEKYESKINLTFSLTTAILFLYLDANEPPRGKPRGIFKGKISSPAGRDFRFATTSCGELKLVDFASLLK